MEQTSPGLTQINKNVKCVSKKINITTRQGIDRVENIFKQLKHYLISTITTNNAYKRLKIKYILNVANETDGKGRRGSLVSTLRPKYRDRWITFLLVDPHDSTSHIQLSLKLIFYTTLQNI